MSIFKIFKPDPRKKLDRLLKKYGENAHKLTRAEKQEYNAKIKKLRAELEGTIS